jgi:hypothetical protein
MGGACGSIPIFFRNPEGKIPFGRPGSNGRIILKWNLKTWRELDVK